MSTMIAIFVAGFIVLLGLAFIARIHAKRQGKDSMSKCRTVGLP